MIPFKPFNKARYSFFGLVLFMNWLLPIKRLYLFHQLTGGENHDQIHTRLGVPCRRCSHYRTRGPRSTITKSFTDLSQE